jgi:O-antigen ligase
MKSTLLSFLVFGYVLSSLTLSGIPGFSLFSAGFCFLLFIFIIIYSFVGILKIERWVIPPFLFILHCGLLAILAGQTALDAFITTLVSWGGAVLVAIAVRDSVSIRVVFIAFAFASVANMIAIFYGFDAYALYVADYRVISEDALLKRPNGLVGNSNLLAIQAILPVFALFLWRNQANWLLWLITSVCMVHAFLVTGSRKSVLLMSLLLFFIVFVDKNKDLVRKIYFSIGFLIAGFVLVWAFDKFGLGFSSLNEVVAIDRITLAFEGKDDSFIDRFDFIGIGWSLFIESPIWGSGLDTFRYISGLGLYSHNNLIELAVSGGVLLLITYHAIFLHIILRARKTFELNDSRRLGYLFMVIVLFILGFAMVSYNNKIISILLALLLANPTFIEDKIRRK